MSSDRFIYNKGDIQIGKSQCDFCKYNCKKEFGKAKQSCSKYPNGKPEDVIFEHEFRHNKSFNIFSGCK